MRTDRSPSLARPPLGELELELLDLLWQAAPADAKSLHQRLVINRASGLNTVQSALERLHRKALLGRRKQSHAYVYEPAVAREELLGTLIGGLVEVVAGGSSEAMLQAFVGCAARVDASALARLEALIAAHRRDEAPE